MVSSLNYATSECTLSYYLNVNDSFTSIVLSSSNTVMEACEYLQFQTDEFENVYINSLYKLGSSYVEYLNHEELKTVGVDFGNADVAIFSVALDGNGDLWASEAYREGANNSVFFVENGSFSAVKVPFFENLTPGALLKNPNANEVLVVSYNVGLYMISN